MKRFKGVTAGLALVVLVFMGVSRGLFAHPNSSLVIVALAVLPFLLDVWWPSQLRSPAVGLGGIGIVLGSTTALMVVEPPAHDVAAFFFVILAARVAAEAPTPLGIVVAAVAIALPEALSIIGLTASPPNVLVGTAFAWFAGYEVRSQQHLMHQLVKAQAALADQAAAAERQRIAREVHDLVAHTLSVTMLHLTGARLALQDADVTEATTALAEAEKAGREALREMRQAVGLLGTPTTANALPGAADVPELVAGYRNAGLQVGLSVHGDLGSVSGDAGLALYRITQESLSNAAKHAPTAPAQVELKIRPKDICLRVRNEVRGPSQVPRGGRGLPGMAERAALVGGTLSAGPVGDVWEVRAVLHHGRP